MTSLAAAPSPNGGNGHDERGRFTAGNAGGPGNPFARRVAAFRAALIDAVGEDGLRDVARAMVEKARSGDVAAARLVLAYDVGRPGEPADPDRLDEHELKVRRAYPTILDLAIVAPSVPMERFRREI